MNELSAGYARLNISVARRLSDIAAYKRQIAEYVTARATKTLEEKEDKKIVIYTAISGGYDSIKLPEKPDPRVDYVLFTDTPTPDTGIYQVRPITYFHEDATRAARFVKTHPHMLLDGYDIAIWIDSNIMILGDIHPLVEEFLASGKAVAAVPHPLRKSVYEELEACIRLKKDDAKIMQEQLSHYRIMDFDHGDLIESNLIMFNLRDDRVRPFLDAWWTENDRYSKRDQLSLNYALTQNNVEWHRLTESPSSVRNHPVFAFTRHDAGDGPAGTLIDALQVPFADPYAGPAYAGIRSQRIAAQRHRRVDIVVCVHNALEYVRPCLESVRCTRNGERQRLIIIDDGSDQPTARYLEEFARNAPWIELNRNEHARGYTKAANQGLAASTGELVILLNSDTFVTDGWTEKMADAVFSTPGGGIVGPMSNAASHQSIPEHRSSKDQTAINDLPPGLTAEDMNRYCEQWTTAGVLPRVPLVHGFCFGVTREVIDRIGFFDDDSFPKGYGEENDYCFRAADTGFGLVVATHTYVLHAKSKSYDGPERVALMKAGSEALRRLHGRPRIQRAVRSMQENPIFVNLRQRARRLTDVSRSPPS
jgi:GT2 family glycosyltransferase